MLSSSPNVVYYDHSNLVYYDTMSMHGLVDGELASTWIIVFQLVQPSYLFHLWAIIKFKQILSRL